MAYDGIFINKQINEIKNILLNEHISKITQCSSNDINLHIRKFSKDLILTISANPSFPYIILSTNNIINKNTPPAFCMLLRKYIQGGIITNINSGNPFYINENSNNNTNVSLERIIDVQIENINEQGNICLYHIFIEIMGKYSNIIVTDSSYVIIDTLYKSNEANTRLKVKNKYSLESICNKKEILNENYSSFCETVNSYKALQTINNEKFNYQNCICNSYAGISQNTITHIFNKLRLINKELNENNFIDIKNEIKLLLADNNTISTIHYKNDKPSDFYIIKLSQYEGITKSFDSLNECLNAFIKEKFTTINDSTEKKNIENIILQLYNKLNKKITMLNSDIEKSKNYEKYKLFGELISAYGYNKDLINNNILSCENYYDNNSIIEIPIDDSVSISDNIDKYYKKYNKLKRTNEKANELLIEVYNKLEHLNSIKTSISLSNDKNDIYLIKEEINNYFEEANSLKGLIKTNKKNNSKAQKNNKKFNYNIHHYKSTSGIDIYVGKNNLQNEHLTFTLASPNDTWLHIKNATGSHVIVKKPYEDLDDTTLIEAASIAAYFSEKKNETKATVDYTLRKELKKVKGKAPGFCIYHKNFSINVTPKILLKEI